MASILSKKVIGISGYARSGKDTAAGIVRDLLISKLYNPKTIRFADPIKDAAAAFFNIDLDTLEKFKEANTIIHGISVRQALQNIGESMRSVNEDIFPQILLERANQYVYTADNICIIPDLRFVNEEQCLRDYYGVQFVHIQINRPSITLKALTGEPPYDHMSEHDIIKLTPDIVIQNGGDIDDLKHKLMKVII